MDEKDKEIKEKIRYILTPSAPREAAEHGGVIDWAYSYNKEGMEFMVDKIMEVIEEERQKSRDEGYEFGLSAG